MNTYRKCGINMQWNLFSRDRGERGEGGDGGRERERRRGKEGIGRGI